MKKLVLYVAFSAMLPVVACTGNTNTRQEQTDPPVTTVAPAIEEEPADQTIGQRIDTANAAMKRTAANVKQEVNDAADTAKKGIKKAAEVVKDGAKQAAAEVKSAAQEVKKEVKETTGKAAGKVEQKAKAVKEDMSK